MVCMRVESSVGWTVVLSEPAKVVLKVDVRVFPLVQTMAEYWAVGLVPY